MLALLAFGIQGSIVCVAVCITAEFGPPMTSGDHCGFQHFVPRHVRGLRLQWLLGAMQGSCAVLSSARQLHLSGFAQCS